MKTILKLRKKDENKKQTDYVGDKGYTVESFKIFIPSVSKGCRGPLDNFFQREEESSHEEDKSSSDEDINREDLNETIAPQSMEIETGGDEDIN